MHKTCLAKSNGDTPNGDLFTTSTTKKPGPEQVDILASVHVLGLLSGLLPTAPAAHLVPLKKGVLVFVSRPTEILKSCVMIYLQISCKPGQGQRRRTQETRRVMTLDMRGGAGNQTGEWASL